MGSQACFYDQISRTPIFKGYGVGKTLTISAFIYGEYAGKNYRVRRCVLMKLISNLGVVSFLALSMPQVIEAQSNRRPVPQIQEKTIPKQTRPRPNPRQDFIQFKKIKYAKADYTLTLDKVKAMRANGGAPIFGSHDNNERRFTVVLSEGAGIIEGRGKSIARQRDRQVKTVVMDVLRTARVNRQVIRSRFVTSGAINAVTLTNPTAQTLRRLSQDKRVLYIEQVTIDRLYGVDSNPQSWGLDRIDQRNLPLDTEFEYSENGNVDIWIIDSGIRSTHTEFSGRIVSRVNLTNDGNPDDCNGHGTHVAGTAGGSVYGVARNANLRVVKVASCGNTFPSIMTQAGINEVYNNASGPSVVNISLGGSFNLTTNNGIAGLSEAGITAVVAAGNNGGSACLKSPASAPSAITVAASDNLDGHAFFGGPDASNHGGCVDIYAPGKYIKSAWYTGDTDTNTINGTSMASPHVAGIAAALTTDSNCESAWKIHDQIVSSATVGVVGVPAQSPSTPNRLAYYELPAPVQVWSDFTALYQDYSQCLSYFEPNGLSTDLVTLGNCLNTPPAPSKTLKALRVKGHTDTSKAADASMIQSCNYAHVVTKYIRTNYPGIPVIETAHGEHDPFIQTGDGVHEQLNRRVEILGLWD